MPRAAQSLAAAGQRGAHLTIVESQFARRLAAVHSAQLDQRQGVHGLGVQLRQPGADVGAGELRIGRLGPSRGQRAEGGVLHGPNIPAAAGWQRGDRC